jgi:hypothetical protein
LVYNWDNPLSRSSSEESASIDGDFSRKGASS